MAALAPSGCVGDAGAGCGDGLVGLGPGASRDWRRARHQCHGSLCHRVGAACAHAVALGAGSALVLCGFRRGRNVPLVAGRAGLAPHCTAAAGSRPACCCIAAGREPDAAAFPSGSLGVRADQPCHLGAGLCADPAGLVVRILLSCLPAELGNHHSQFFLLRAVRPHDRMAAVTTGLSCARCRGRARCRRWAGRRPACLGMVADRLRVLLRVAAAPSADAAVLAGLESRPAPAYTGQLRPLRAASAGPFRCAGRGCGGGPRTSR